MKQGDKVFIHNGTAVYVKQDGEGHLVRIGDNVKRIYYTPLVVKEVPKFAVKDGMVCKLYGAQSLVEEDELSVMYAYLHASGRIFGFRYDNTESIVPHDGVFDSTVLYSLYEDKEALEVSIRELNGKLQDIEKEIKNEREKCPHVNVNRHTDYLWRCAECGEDFPSRGYNEFAFYPHIFELC